MHGTQRSARATALDFARLQGTVAQARKTEKRRGQLYARIFAIVEDRVEREALVSPCVIAKAIGLDSAEANRLINEYRPLARFISKYQRKYGNTLAERRMIEGPFVPCK